VVHETHPFRGCYHPRSAVIAGSRAALLGTQASLWERGKWFPARLSESFGARSKNPPILVLKNSWSPSAGVRGGLAARALPDDDDDDDDDDDE